MLKLMIATASIAALGEGGANAAEKPRSTKEILQSFADDYKTDHMAIDARFGVQVGEEWWSVSVARKEEDYTFKEKFTFQNFGPHEVAVAKGKPKEPTWYISFADKSVLEQVDSGGLSVGTGAMKSFASDKTMVDVGGMEGFAETPGSVAECYHTMSHFFARGTPEVTYFEREKSLPTHGASAVSLYLMKDKRIAWFSIGKDEAANADPALEYGQVPNLIIITKGEGKGKFGDKELDLRPGMSIFVGPYVKHVFYGTGEEPLEGILVLFGDNGDFAFGKSYLDFVDADYEFLRGFDPKGE
jgi:mannose-6-phosphate isomerase-like protein (cupin superfamily)